MRDVPTAQSRLRVGAGGVRVTGDPDLAEAMSDAIEAFVEAIITARRTGQKDGKTMEQQEIRTGALDPQPTNDVTARVKRLALLCRMLADKSFEAIRKDTDGKLTEPLVAALIINADEPAAYGLDCVSQHVVVVMTHGVQLRNMQKYLDDYVLGGNTELTAAVDRTIKELETQ